MNPTLTLANDGDETKTNKDCKAGQEPSASISGCSEACFNKGSNCGFWMDEEEEIRLAQTIVCIILNGLKSTI